MHSCIVSTVEFGKERKDIDSGRYLAVWLSVTLQHKYCSCSVRSKHIYI